MAQDAWVKDAELLSGFASDLRETQASILGHLSRLSSAAYEKESDLRVYVNRIEDALSDALSRLEEARYEYDCYLRHTDEEEFSTAYADGLRAEVEAAESLCHRIAEDLNDARSTLDQALFLLQGLRSVAEGFSSRAGHLAETAAANVDAAAFEIAQYKTIR